MNKKTVLHVLSSNSYSGAENVAITIIQNMDEKYNVYYICPNGTIIEALEERSINYKFVKKFNIFCLAKILLQFHPDIVHAHDFTATYIMTILKLIGFKFKVISQIHQDPNWLHKKGFKLYSLILISKYVDHFILVNKNILTNSIFEKIQNKILLSNIVNINYIESKRKEKAAQSSDFIFVGRLTEVKDPFFLLNVLKEYKKINPKYRCYILGDGPLYKECLNFIQLEGLTNNVILEGFVQNPYPYISKSKMLLLTSKSEGLPMVVNEALCLGKPVISTDIDGLQIFKEKEFVFLCNSVEKFIISMRITENDKLYRILSEKSCKYASTNFDLKKYCDKIEEIYEKA